MATRAERREARQIEDRLKAVALLIVLGAFAFASPSNFGAIPALFAFLFVVALVGFACYLVARSSHPPLRRGGICAIIVGLFLCGAWKVFKAPPEWPATQGMVLKVTAPPGVVETEYDYQVGNSIYSVRKSKEAPNVDDAKRSAASPIALYVDPRQPTRVSEQPLPGFTRVQGKPSSNRVTLRGPYKATVLCGGLFGTFLGGTQVVFEDESLGSLKPSASIPVYANPTTNGQYWSAEGDRLEHPSCVPSDSFSSTLAAGFA